ncbi:MAG TPA: hypothetical protein VJ867_01625, partial [Gemmatimonadaceae bacterium]|nr:hypothetical protein [Gemmatimonadaceae bacterium]
VAAFLDDAMDHVARAQGSIVRAKFPDAIPLYLRVVDGIVTGGLYGPDTIARAFGQGVEWFSFSLRRFIRVDERRGPEIWLPRPGRRRRSRK